MSTHRVFIALSAALFSFYLFTPARAADFDPGENPPYAAAVLVEVETGTVLFAYNAHEQRSQARAENTPLEAPAMLARPRIRAPQE